MWRAASRAIQAAPINSRSPVRAATCMLGKAFASRSSSTVRSAVEELPSLGRNDQMSAMPTPFHSTAIIKRLTLVRPKRQFVRSMASTQGLPASPSRATTMRGDGAIEVHILEEARDAPPGGGADRRCAGDPSYNCYKMAVGLVDARVSAQVGQKPQGAGRRCQLPTSTPTSGSANLRSSPYASPGSRPLRQEPMLLELASTTRRIISGRDGASFSASPSPNGLGSGRPVSSRRFP